MTYKEAIENLEYMMDDGKVCLECPYEQALLSEEEQETCRIAIKALEKQMLIKEKINEVITKLDALQETATVDYRSTLDSYFAGGAYAYDLAKKAVVELYKTFRLE